MFPGRDGIKHREQLAIAAMVAQPVTSGSEAEGRVAYRPLPIAGTTAVFMVRVSPSRREMKHLVMTDFRSTAPHTSERVKYLGFDRFPSETTGLQADAGRLSKSAPRAVAQLVAEVLEEDAPEVRARMAPTLEGAAVYMFDAASPSRRRATIMIEGDGGASTLLLDKATGTEEISELDASDPSTVRAFVARAVAFLSGRSSVADP